MCDAAAVVYTRCDAVADAALVNETDGARVRVDRGLSPPCYFDCHLALGFCPSHGGRLSPLLAVILKYDSKRTKTDYFNAKMSKNFQDWHAPPLPFRGMTHRPTQEPHPSASRPSPRGLRHALDPLLLSHTSHPVWLWQRNKVTSI